MKKQTEKIIYKVYKEYYQKTPDFNKNNLIDLINLTIEIQSMAYMLNEYGISIGESGFYYAYTDLEMPISIDIQDIIVEKMLGHNNDLDDDSLKLSKKASKTINIIGKIIRHVISNDSEPLEKLRKITNILYVKRYVSPTAKEEELIKMAKCSEKDLILVNRLTEIINQEICKDNFDQTNIENITKMIDGDIEILCINDDQVTSQNKKGSRKKLVQSLFK